MQETKGRSLPLSGPRRFIIDLVHFARKVPSIPVARTMNVGALMGPRKAHPLRPSWAVLFMKAYARVAAANPPLRRALLTFPWMRLYEHPTTVCALALEREYRGEEAIFVGLFRAPNARRCKNLIRRSRPTRMTRWKRSDSSGRPFGSARHPPRSGDFFGGAPWP